jgi:hypothetical protein|tara:strand:- start:323 stop:1120 length:798 start_codon:yes stop_codon:yes gene_type:complete
VSEEHKKVLFKEIWETFRAVDVSDYTEEKIGLTYLSWARAWMLTVDNYANAQYTFHDFDGVPYRTLPDGTAEVVTSVNIEGHIRSMPLPVMDYKNNSIVTPNSRQVNDNRMRCLVKNLAMFGLGMGVFAVWEDHLPSAEKDVQPKNKQLPKATPKSQTKPESKPKPKPKPEVKSKPDTAVKTKDIEDYALGEIAEITSAEGAENLVGFMLQLAGEFSETPDQLKDFYRKNKATIDIIDRDWNEQYEKLREGFSALKDKFLTKEDE